MDPGADGCVWWEVRGREGNRWTSGKDLAEESGLQAANRRQELDMLRVMASTHVGLNVDWSMWVPVCCTGQ